MVGSCSVDWSIGSELKLLRAWNKFALSNVLTPDNNKENSIDQLSATELQQLHEKLSELPAGASSGVGLILGIIFIFIVLDLLGATDVFPRI